MEKLFVIKIGGNIIDNDDSLRSFLQSFSSVKSKKILVHGGGKIATAVGEKLGIASTYIDGRRITGKEDIDLVTMVYGGLVSKKIVALLQSMQQDAIGLTGADGNIIPAVKRPVVKTDYGYVGDPLQDKVSIDKLQLFLNNDMIPVIAPLTHDGNGQLLNTNADTIASVTAVALSGIYDVRLVYCFDKKGVLENINDEDSVISDISMQYHQQLLKEGKLADGIIPKLQNAFDAINKGVNEVLIGDAADVSINCSATFKGTLCKA